MAEVTITLRGAAAERLQKLVAEERYEGPEEAVADALEALDATRDATLDTWLKTVVAARGEALAADPSRARTAAEMRARLFGQG